MQILYISEHIRQRILLINEPEPASKVRIPDQKVMGLNPGWSIEVLYF